MDPICNHVFGKIGPVSKRLQFRKNMFLNYKHCFIYVYPINNNPYMRFRKSTCSKCALINIVCFFVILDGAHFEHVDFGKFISRPEWTDSKGISPTPRLP